MGEGAKGKMENKWLKEQSARRRRRCGTRKMAINFYLCPFVCRRKICIINNYLTLELTSFSSSCWRAVCKKAEESTATNELLNNFLLSTSSNLCPCNTHKKKYFVQFHLPTFCLLMCVLISPPWCKKTAPF